MASYTLTEAGDDTNKVTVQFAAPADWKTDSAGPQPSWKADGLPTLQLVTIGPSGKDNATRVEKAIKAQFGGAAGATRNDYPDGRVWIAQPQGSRIHARMFVPYASGVAMGFAMVADASKLDAVKAAFETLKIAP